MSNSVVTVWQCGKKALSGGYGVYEHKAIIQDTITGQYGFHRSILRQLAQASVRTDSFANYPVPFGRIILRMLIVGQIVRRVIRASGDLTVTREMGKHLQVVRNNGASSGVLVPD
ncbi:hypothetical protein [Izhakiella capsodis]|uniref:hypothetical protein n=1 Tax=Izhakiella capsodis TaxID=1367852 RepID=UPI000B890CBC|nr:hypothetical protein [Izhakiella capsodis]